MSIRSPASPLLSGFLLLALAATLHAGDIAVYWGQNRYEGSLEEACDAEVYSIINIAYLTDFGDFRTPQLSLAGHCDRRYGCSVLAKQIKACQEKGIKVLLSLGGSYGRYTLVSRNDAKYLASYLWNSFLGGSARFRPLGDAVLDGIDFDIEGGGTMYYDSLARVLREVTDSDPSRKYYLTASPGCLYPSQYLGPAIATGHMDYVWVKFYDDYHCQYSYDGNDGGLLHSWNLWQNVDAGKVFLGLPASPDAAPYGGYIPPDVLVDRILPHVKTSEAYGGVMLWSRYYDLQSNYSQQIMHSIGRSGISTERPHLSTAE